jgi:hypothetical protein
MYDIMSRSVCCLLYVCLCDYVNVDVICVTVVIRDWLRCCCSLPVYTYAVFCSNCIALLDRTSRVGVVVLGRDQ